MPFQTDALILRENNTIGEADRFITALTRSHGVVRASVRGARQMKSRSGSATRMLTYSRLTLTQGKNKYVVTNAVPLHVFYEVRDMETLALAQYFCELGLSLAPREEPAEDSLRLMLNSLHFLTAGERDKRLLKAVTELRLLAGAGYAPDLSGCRRCGRTDGSMHLLPTEGVLYCPACGVPGNACELPAAALLAMRHVLHSALEKCYAIRLDTASLEALAAASERLLLAQLNRGFSTLDFYHTVCGS